VLKNFGKAKYPGSIEQGEPAAPIVLFKGSSQMLIAFTPPRFFMGLVLFVQFSFRDFAACVGCGLVVVSTPNKGSAFFRSENMNI
jgi:hypothetical protein